MLLAEIDEEEGGASHQPSFNAVSCGGGLFRYDASEHLLFAICRRSRRREEVEPSVFDAVPQDEDFAAWHRAQLPSLLFINGDTAAGAARARTSEGD